MGSGFFFILGIVLSNTYRPYIYENHIFDFHLADTIGNLVAVPSLSLLLLAMRKYESLSKAILYSIFVFTLYEIGAAGRKKQNRINLSNTLLCLVYFVQLRIAKVKRGQRFQRFSTLHFIMKIRS